VRTTASSQQGKKRDRERRVFKTGGEKESESKEKPVSERETESEYKQLVNRQLEANLFQFSLFIQERETERD
jgi:hypothetical protein